MLVAYLRLMIVCLNQNFWIQSKSVTHSQKLLKVNLRNFQNKFEREVSLRTIIHVHDSTPSIGVVISAA